jgi:ABC-type bacteriocin/lantibiotic exporter with double-glycine peptidase domain
MLFYEKCSYIFTKKELKTLILVFFGVASISILDVLSFGLIVPVFQVILFNETPNFYFFKINNFNMDINFKIIILFTFLLIFLIKNILIIYFTYFSIKSLQNISGRISSQLFNLFLTQDYIIYLKNSSDNYLQKITTDVGNVNNFFNGLLNLIIESIFVIGIAILLFFSNTKMFLFCFFTFFSVFSFYIIYFKGRLKRWSYESRNSNSLLQLFIIEGFRGFKDIIIYNLRSHFINNYNNQLNISNSTSIKLTFLNTVQKYWLEIVGLISISIALIYFIFVDFEITKLVPVLGLFVLAFFRLLSSFSRIILHGQNIKFFYPAFDALALNFKELSNNIRTNLEYQIPFHKSIELINVSFSYPMNKVNILDDVNLKINKGESICIIGKNGSGKSTFLNLVSGLLQSTKGSIIVDEKDDLFTNRNSWIKNLCYVQQNIFLTNSTIKNNIVLNEEKKIDALKFNKIEHLLKLDLFFNELPEKLNTKTGNDGINLSGGQKQIISLARALYKDSNILIFDEPTAALDETKTKLFKEVILSLKGKKTIFMVTHDKSNFENCFDKILYFESGKIKLI